VGEGKFEFEFEFEQEGFKKDVLFTPNLALVSNSCSLSVSVSFEEQKKF